MVECLLGGRTRRWSPREGRVCEGAGDGRCRDPGPGRGAEALEAGEAVSPASSPHSPCLLPHPAPCLSFFLSSPLPPQMFACLPCARQATGP